MFETAVDLVRIGDGAPGLGDFWSIAISNPLAFPNGTLYVAISLQDSTATRISDSSSFFVNTSLAGWGKPDFGILIVDSSATPVPRRLLALGTMTSLPEPDLALGLGCAAMLLGAGGRRRGRRERRARGARVCRPRLGRSFADLELEIDERRMGDGLQCDGGAPAGAEQPEEEPIG